MKGSTVLTCLILASLVTSAQENRSIPPNDPTARTFYWSEKPDAKDLEKWLMANEVILRRGDACTLTYWWMDEEHPYPSSSTTELATFITLPQDEELTKAIHDPRSGLDIRVGIRYVPGDSKNPYMLQIALAFEGLPDGVFDEANRAQAETVRSPSWRWLGVVKPIRLGDMRYTYSLHCQNGREYLTSMKWVFSPHNSKSPGS